MKHVLMLAAENDGLAGGKVGGIGDVVRDIPPALAQQGCTVDVLIPSYGFLHNRPGTKSLASISFDFAGTPNDANIYEVEGRKPCKGVRQLVVDHPYFKFYDKERGQFQIYVNDPPGRAFATDATKYALLCVAVAAALKGQVIKGVDCIHLHDWHAAFFLLLCKYDPAYKLLRKIRTVYTIHNLALQGIRPLGGNDPEGSSPAQWYPSLDFSSSKQEDSLYKDCVDPRYPNCINPMAVGIRLSDAVHTVSETYAEEICKPSKKPTYFGGEGLESDLQAAKDQGRLVGILNGCEYPENRVAPEREFSHLLDILKSEVLLWAGRQRALSASHFLAYNRLSELEHQYESPGVLLTSVSRVVEQKMSLMCAETVVSLNDESFSELQQKSKPDDIEVPGAVIGQIAILKNREYVTETSFADELKDLLGERQYDDYWPRISRTARVSNFKSAIERILNSLRDRGVYILLGTGDVKYEQHLTRMSSLFKNFIFLNGYSNECANNLYASGHLFLMPSSFEPCGISQMLAMRDGQPCVVHAVGGLKETVGHQTTDLEMAAGTSTSSLGFLFSGGNIQTQIENFTRITLEAIGLKISEPRKFEKISRKASIARFSWSKSAANYVKFLYKA